jgi:hypothetical protein
MDCLGTFSHIKLQVINIWHHPIIQNCTRIRLFGCLMSSSDEALLHVRIFEWLHHRPTGTDCDDDQAQVRCMIRLRCAQYTDDIHLLLDRCAKVSFRFHVTFNSPFLQALRESHVPADRRQFVLSFDQIPWRVEKMEKRIGRIAESKSTGEVLTLEHGAPGMPDQLKQYRLRRCLAEEVGAGAEFYAKMFKQNPSRGYGDDYFNIEKVPIVTESERYVNPFF